MLKILNTVKEYKDAFFSWFDTFLKRTNESYCELQTADSSTSIAANDGSLMTIIRISGVTALIGVEEFRQIHSSLLQTLKTSLAHEGHSIQVYFNYDRETIGDEIMDNIRPAQETAKKLHLDLDDYFAEKLSHLKKYCASEEVYLALWTKPNMLTSEQFNQSMKEKQKLINTKKIPPFIYTQSLIAAIPELRDEHDSFVRAVYNDLNSLNIVATILEAHEALYEVRKSFDPEFTDRHWRPVLPGDKINVKELKNPTGNITDILWPSLSRQIMPRDGFNRNLRTVRIGDRIYSSVFIDLFPKDVQTFMNLFGKILQNRIPWRISFLIDGGGLASTKLKAALTAVLSWTSAQNRLINDSLNLLEYVNLNTDNAIVKLRVALSTWAPEDDPKLLRTRAAQLAIAVESWGSCDVSEISGDAFEGATSSVLGLRKTSVATASIATLSDVLVMLPLFRPASLWNHGSLLLRSPDGKLWPYQPGSKEQTTWIDLIYARPGSGKSVLSNAINLSLCLAPGITRLPRIAIIDIGPSSSGLISLLQEALPPEERHLVAYHKLRMRPEYSVNPFDTQLGCRFPMPQERSFLVNFLTLLATPISSTKPYDGIPDMCGLIIDELYRNAAPDENPRLYVRDVEEIIDAILEEIGFVVDSKTTWWEVTDTLFIAGFVHEAILAQRHAMPTLADATSICRLPAIEDLYGKIIAPTGETLINSFSRMISAAIREYPILATYTRFDIGDARITSIDLDEVAKSGGDAATRQTAIMYMLARYILGRNFYLNEDNLADVSDIYKKYHEQRILEIKEDKKRFVFDEFHRTAKTQAVRDQVLVDMREGRKWNVQIAVISQSIDDFDSSMIEFATSSFIMDAGPEQAIKKTTATFGLSPTATAALRQYVHGPRESGSTFLAIFATKRGVNTQLLTATLGPIELWAFTTTAEDANIRDQLYRKIGPIEARRVLATLFPSGSATSYINKKLAEIKEDNGIIDSEAKLGVIDNLIKNIIENYIKNPDFKHLF